MYLGPTHRKLLAKEEQLSLKKSWLTPNPEELCCDSLMGPFQRLPPTLPSVFNVIRT
jgi:hypothetical protein